MCNKIKVIAIIMIAIRIIFVVVCLCVNFLILDEKAIVFCVLLDFFHHSAEKLWIVACFYSVPLLFQVELCIDKDKLFYWSAERLPSHHIPQEN